MEEIIKIITEKQWEVDYHTRKLNQALAELKALTLLTENQSV